jgi:hypothetical protein
MRKAASEASRKAADARDLAPTIAELPAAGATSLCGIAAGLNARGTAVHGVVQVQRVLERRS